jgi:hypothetical protein
MARKGFAQSRTGGGSRFDKKALMREIEKDRRAKVKARLLELKSEIAAARSARNAAIAEVRSDCRLKREELRQSCGLRRDRAKHLGETEVQRRARILSGERSDERAIRYADRSKLRGTAKARARERREEDDDAVRSNIDADMIPVFDAVRKYIKGTLHRSRTEAFLEWAEENPGEVIELRQRESDRHLDKLLAEQQYQEAELRQKPARRRRASSSRFEDVPF